MSHLNNAADAARLAASLDTFDFKTCGWDPYSYKHLVYRFAQAAVESLGPHDPGFEADHILTICLPRFGICFVHWARLADEGGPSSTSRHRQQPQGLVN